MSTDADIAGAGPAAPVRAGERIVALDVLRGVALLGIFIMNMPGFSHSLFAPPATDLGLVDRLAAGLREADRVLRPEGRLLVVHDYGRDDVSALRDPQSPEYRVWSRREGPFLADAQFKIRVVHCFWTFASMDEARAFLVDAFGEKGEAVGARLKRPRLSWNVAVYHRWRGGVAPEAGAELAGAPAGPLRAVAGRTRPAGPALRRTRRDRPDRQRGAGRRQRPGRTTRDASPGRGRAGRARPAG